MALDVLVEATNPPRMVRIDPCRVTQPASPAGPARSCCKPQVANRTACVRVCTPTIGAGGALRCAVAHCLSSSARMPSTAEAKHHLKVEPPKVIRWFSCCGAHACQRVTTGRRMGGARLQDVVLALLELEGGGPSCGERACGRRPRAVCGTGLADYGAAARAQRAAHRSSSRGPGA